MPRIYLKVERFNPSTNDSCGRFNMNCPIT